MRRVSVAIGLAVLLLGRAAAQQTQLTEGQLKAAAHEMPQLVELLELKPGMTVADVGAGFGAWTMEFAKVVGPNGRVYASDIGSAQALLSEVCRMMYSGMNTDRLAIAIA